MEVLMESENSVHRDTWIKLFWVVLFCFMIAPPLSMRFLEVKARIFLRTR